MIKSLLLADNRHDLLATLEPILKHWGYRVLTATNIAQTQAFLASSSPVMLLVGGNLLNDPALQLPQPSLPLLAIAHPDSGPQHPAADLTLGMPVDIFALFSFIQSRVERHPRRNLRLQLHLPGMCCSRGKEFVLADVLSLSIEGLFLRSPLRLAIGDRVISVFSLLGHGRELEVAGTVLYIVEPTPENNYAQGFGLSFMDLTEEQTALLKHFIAERFLSEVSTSQAGVGTFSTSHVQR